MNDKIELDILQSLQNICIEYGVSVEIAEQIKGKIYSEFGGRSIYIKKKEPNCLDRAQQILKDAGRYKTDVILKRYCISRATLHRLKKQKCPNQKV